MVPLQISPEELSLKLQSAGPKPVLLDCRTEEEHVLVALPESVLIPLHEFPGRTDELRTFEGQEVVVYCHHGIRSLQAASLLRELGVEASSLAGGIERYACTVDPSLPRY